MAEVKLEHIVKQYSNGFVAVKDFTMDIADQEFVVLVGPSGCGKSTTMRMIAGLESITEGKLYIGGQLVNDVSPKDRDIAMVFQSYALYPHMTAYDNMAFALKLQKVSKSEIDKRVREAAEILGITQLLNNKPKAMSGGQRQRVAIGRAIVREPKVFLMDEPLSNLDAKLRNQMRAEIIKLRKRINTTFIYVTHDQTEAMTLGDRIVVMKDGVVQQMGTPQEVFDHPVNLFVAGFIGTPQMNTFPAELVRSGDSYSVKIMDRLNPLPEDKCRILKDNGVQSGKVTAGIRPEHLQVLAEPTSETYHLDISVSEMLGSEVYMHAQMDGSDVVIRTPTLNATKDGLWNSYEQHSVDFVIPPQYLHLFNPQSGDSLFAKPSELPPSTEDMNRHLKKSRAEREAETAV
ncbi:MAG: sn-glycerol-3-phosphate ABC transporter ATP-binding protein UgpC [Clostridia bacterium]|nr:sn-glycerol-3-phosphate ABC transporter ATP-binding protein UgpC [Clostridia bacterium]